MDDALRAEHESIQRAVARSRRAAEPGGQFARAMMQVMDDYRAMRKAGVGREDACKGIEEGLRGLWPKPVSKFAPACQQCDGTGYMERTCWAEQRCERASPCANAHPAFEHRYVLPCDCALGDRFRRQYVQPVEDAVVAAGRGQKRKQGGWRQVGS